MIRQLSNKPNVGFDHLGSEFMWLECYDERGPYCVVAVDFANNGIAAFHVSLIRWSHNVLKQFMQDCENIKEFCKYKNCRLLVVSTRNIENTKWKKFVSRFGFSKTDLLLVSQQEV